MQRLRLGFTSRILIRKSQSPSLESAALTSNKLTYRLTISIVRLKSIQKLGRTKSPLIKSSRLEKRNSSINTFDVQKSAIREKTTSTASISSARYSKHSHPMNKRLSESKPLADSKKSDLNSNQKSNKHKVIRHTMNISEYYNINLAHAKPKTARK